MKRRDFITLLGSAAASWPIAARGQQSEQRVGMLLTSDPSNQDQRSYIAAFEQALRTSGWNIGQNLEIDYRWAAGDFQSLHDYSVELIALKPNVIVVGSTAGLNAVRPAARSIPIIFFGVSDPVAQGFVSSLAHPGGNITGFAAFEFSMGAKWLDLLKKISPNLTRVTLLFNPDTSPQYKFYLASIEAAAPQFGIEIDGAAVRSGADLEGAVMAASSGPGGLIVGNDNFLLAQHLRELVGLAIRYRAPAVYGQRPWVQAGGLLYYGFNSVEQSQALALYVDHILKGAKAADLPVQQPTRFEFVINLKTAKALGLTVPPSLLAVADEVIE
jgi:putative tryptophan/tyrosine transport system substrate-binding protein